MRVRWIAFGMKWAEIRSGTFFLEEGQSCRDMTLYARAGTKYFFGAGAGAGAKAKEGKNVIRSRSGSRLKYNRLRIRFESNSVRISQCSIPPGQTIPPPGQPTSSTRVAWPPCRPVKVISYYQMKLRQYCFFARLKQKIIVSPPLLINL